MEIFKLWGVQNVKEYEKAKQFKCNYFIMNVYFIYKYIYNIYLRQ